MGLRDALLHADGGQEELLRRLLRFDFCMPRESGARRLAERTRRETGLRALGPGETLLVSVAASRSSLWLLSPEPPAPGRVPFIGSARCALEAAECLVTRDLPLVLETDLLSRAWSAERLITGTEQSLDGPSFGLSFCLAAASRLLGVPLPSRLVASAVVTAEGELRGVGEAVLESKFRIVSDWTPGIDVFLVAEDDADPARRAAERIGVSFEVIAAPSLHEALAHAYPNLIEELESSWRDGASREHAARRLFRLVRDGSPLMLGWQGVARSCRWLAEGLPGNSSERRQMQFAEAVARRHAGEEVPCPIDLAWVSDMRRPLRLRVLAHLIEHSRFQAAAERDRVREYAEQQLSRSAEDDSAEDLRVLGALGRTDAAYGNFFEAERNLLRAVRGYDELGLLDEGSFALAEWIRILGVERRKDDLRQLIGDLQATSEGAKPPWQARVLRDFLRTGVTSSMSRAFVVLALGRALVQISAPLDALSFLGDRQDALFSLAPTHLRASRLRWLRSALALLGRHDASDRARERLALLADRDTEARFAAHLSDIDRALEAGADATLPLVALAALEPKAIALIEQVMKPDGDPDRARAVARYYPY